MERARIDISQQLDGDPVVFACFDLGLKELEASAHAIAAVSAERFRLSDMSADEVLELRELTALTDELAELAHGGAMGTVVLRPARLAIYRDAVIHFLASRQEAEWLREEDREPLALLHELRFGLEQLCAEAVRAALAPSPRVG
jgi:hypothetical protein